MKLHIIMHESFEAPAAIEAWAKSKNHQIAYTRTLAEIVLRFILIKLAN